MMLNEYWKYSQLANNEDNKKDNLVAFHLFQDWGFVGFQYVYCILIYNII